MPPLRIPPLFLAGVESLAKMDDKTASELLAVLREEARILTTDRLAEHVGESVPDLAEEADSVLEALLSLTTLLPEEGNGAEELANDVAISEDLSLNTAERDTFALRLRPMLEIETLAIAARASGIVTEYGRVFHDARILNDLRPVFGKDPRDGPKAAALIASLKVDYHLPEGKIESDFYALEHSDLLRLRETIDRAIAKHASLRELMERMNLPYWEYLEVHGDPDN